jgi:hypothetical protein
MPVDSLDRERSGSLHEDVLTVNGGSCGGTKNAGPLILWLIPNLRAKPFPVHSRLPGGHPTREDGGPHAGLVNA